MLKFLKRKRNLEVLYAPCNGRVVQLEDIEDQVFSQKMMGDGIGIIPEDENIYSPVDGEVLQIFNTKHAVVIKSSNNKNILIHVGLETVSLNGVPFKLNVSVGNKLSKGDKIMTVDLEYIKSKGLKTITPIIIMNDLEESKKIIVEKTLKEEVRLGEELYKVK